MSGRTEITILMDNTANAGFLSEWGLSMAIRTERNLWIWDTGQSDGFIKNASKLNVDIRKASGIALSHGHWDHGDGLAELAKTGFDGPVFSHPDALLQSYTPDKNGIRAVSLSTAAIDFLERHISPTLDTQQIDENLWYVANIECSPQNPHAKANFFMDRECTEKAQFKDDALLYLETESGPVVVLGCCHSGLRNSLDHVQKTFKTDSIYSLVGGLHLFKGSEEDITDAIETLRKYDVQCVYPGHCTGDKACSRLKKELGNRVFKIASGTKMVF